MEDREIVDLYWARDERALKETGKKYGRLLRKLSLGILCSDEDCEEVLNDAYLAAWNSIPENRPDNLCAYLCRITRNLSLNRRRFNTADKRRSEYDLCLEELQDFLRTPDSVETSFDAADTGRLISAFLAAQDPQTRGIFLRRFWFFDPPSAIAKRYGMKINTVKSILYRTKLRLSEYLKSEGVQL